MKNKNLLVVCRAFLGRVTQILLDKQTCPGKTPVITSFPPRNSKNMAEEGFDGDWAPDNDGEDAWEDEAKAK